MREITKRFSNTRKIQYVENDTMEQSRRLLLDLYSVPVVDDSLRIK